MNRNPLILHVNYVEQGQSIADMCSRAGEWGYEGIEFRRRRSPQEKPETYLDEIARCAERAGLKHVLFGGPGPDLMNPDADARRRSIDECATFYRQASRRFPLTVCNIMTGELLAPGTPREAYEKHGSAAADDRQWKWAAEGLLVLGQMAAELGFRLALETHMLYLHDLPGPSLRLVQITASKAVGINLDYGNMLQFPAAPGLDETFEMLRDHVYLLHLKNLLIVPGPERPVCLRCPLADGAINHRQLLRLLVRSGYDGPLVLEAPRPGDREWFAREDLAYLRRIIDDLQRENREAPS